MSNEEDEELDPEKIAETRKWLNSEADKLALSNPDCAFLHSSNRIEDVFWEYDTEDLTDLDELGPF